MAELGSYRGGVAKLICELKSPATELHLFDTWEGLPFSSGEEPLWKKGNFAAPFDEVRSYLGVYKNVFFHKGVFPETAAPVKNKKFSLVLIDFDLGECIKDALEFFYPRMKKGGFIVVHDYGVSGCRGTRACEVKRAVDGFFEDKPEIVLKVNDAQALIQKV